MAITFDRQTIAGSTNVSNINTNFQYIQEALEKAISTDGLVPNSMNADFDLNDNDLLNVNTVDATEANISTANVDTLYIDGVLISNAGVGPEGPRGFGLIIPELFGAIGDGVTDDTVALQAMLDSLPVNGICSLNGKTYATTDTLEITTEGVTFRGDGGLLKVQNQYGPGVLISADRVSISVDMIGDYTRIDIRQYDIDQSTPSYLGNSSYLRSAAIYVYNADDVVVEFRRLENFFSGVVLRGETSGVGNNSNRNIVRGVNLNSCDFGVFACQQDDAVVEVQGVTTTMETSLEPHLVYFSDNGAGPISTNNRSVIKARSSDNAFGYAVKSKACNKALIEVFADDMCGSVVLTDSFDCVVRSRSFDVHTTAGPARVIAVQDGCARIRVESPVVEFRTGEKSIAAVYLTECEDINILDLDLTDDRTDATGVPPIQMDDVERVTVVRPVWKSYTTNDEPLVSIIDGDYVTINQPEMWGSDRVAILSGVSNYCTAFLSAALLHGGLEDINGFRMNTTTGIRNTVEWLGNPALCPQRTSAFTVKGHENGLMLRANGTFDVTLPIDLPVGFKVRIMREGTGAIGLAPDTSVTILNSLNDITARYDVVEAEVTISGVSSATWILRGPLS